MSHDFEHQADLPPGQSHMHVDKAKPQSDRTDAARPKRRKLDIDDYVQGVRCGDRAILGRTITLVESSSPKHRKTAQQVLTQLMPHTGNSHRLGITGVPGVGKSTFIEAFGSMLTEQGYRVAVLAVDPSSERTGGSILGDKTRMAKLAVDPNAFIRPSPSAGTLGGVARKTRESMFICEAAGFDVILVETVGVGQSETVVAEMTDFFLVLMLAGAGDELQGIKRGLLELADMIAVNKADGDNELRAKRAAGEYEHAMKYLYPSDALWVPPVRTCSAMTGMGLDHLWTKIHEHADLLRREGLWDQHRKSQLLKWTWTMVDEQLRYALRHHPQVKQMRDAIEAQVAEGTLPPAQAAEQILAAFGIDVTEA